MTIRETLNRYRLPALKRALRAITERRDVYGPARSFDHVAAILMARDGKSSRVIAQLVSAPSEHAVRAVLRNLTPEIEDELRDVPNALMKRAS